MRQKIQNWVFRKIHGNNLVYNTCWEDPRCDKELLHLEEESEVVMITSAGCNALSYLLECPARIHCIDMNPRQNALLELKKAFFKIDSHHHLFECFGKGKMKGFRHFYKDYLRPRLPLSAQKYWDQHLRYFNGKGLRRSFYFYGTSGLIAWLANIYIKNKQHLNTTIQQFFQATSLEQQAQIYQRIEQLLYSKLLVWTMNRHAVMSLAGVPKSQQQLFIHDYENGTWDFLKACTGHVFTNLPAQENYFWRVYFQGFYTQDCCPEYLEEANFKTLSKEIDKVNTYTTTITQFLKDNPKQYSHFVLLDHQDWLAENSEAALCEEWELILKNSRKGTKILLRSAAERVDFFPDFVLEKVKFEKELVEAVHWNDRVGTYASTYLGIVQ
ncbi:MAG: BtaA family protein [Bacteroidota bacterium]